MKNAVLFCLLLVVSLSAQQYKVSLDSVKALDDGGLHIEILSDEPKEKLILPENISINRKFFTMFYSWKTQNDELFSIMVVTKQDGDLLYVDKNNDEDLTNDGEPIFFPFNNNKKELDIKCEVDSLQITKLLIMRTPEIPDSTKAMFVDEIGNLNPKFAKTFGAIKGNFDYKGEKGTFYFDDRLGVRTGKLKTDDKVYLVGLFDYSNNGSFTDTSDIVIVDLNGDEQLKYLEGIEVFRLNDVIRIGKDNYKLSNVDKYGRSIVFSKTVEKATNYYLEYVQKLKSQFQKTNSISDDFWGSSFTTVTGKVIDMKELKGKYILLNFWGEWCSPCRTEIPELKIGYENWKNKVVFLSFLKPHDFKRAMKFVEDEKIFWDQIVLNKEVEDGFKIVSYPTNILILPDGKTYLKEGQINRTFFDMNIK